ncbi:MAG: hypothetical protein EBT13_15650 [Rhodobacteraceae bacterium]|jgi:hypothetical protein|nr:hypothetical protein [Paracoccaceae bacterium]
MRPANFTTDDPPCKIDNLELAEYVLALRRRIEVQNDLATSLATEIQHLKTEIDKLSLDLGIRDGQVGPAWQEVRP